MSFSAAKVVYDLLREVNDASKGLQFHKEKGRALNQRIQLLRSKVDAITRETQPELYSTALASLQLHLKSACIVFQECSKGKLFRLLGYKRLMQDIAAVNRDITQSLVDIQFIQPKEDITALLGAYFVGFKGMDAAENALECRHDVEVNLRNPAAVLQTISGLESAGHVSGADIARYKSDLEELRRQNGNLQQLLVNATDNQAALRSRKAAAEDVIMDQVVAMLSQMTTGGPCEKEPDVPHDFRCPISLGIMVNPVILVETGFTFEREELDQWFSTGATTCPTTNEPLQSTSYVANIALRNTIQAWALEHGVLLPARSPTSHLGPSPDVPGPRTTANSAPSLPLEETRFYELNWRAEEGDADAQYEVGVCYGSGNGVDYRDPGQAAAWYRKAADQGHAGAQCSLGNCYESGSGLPAKDMGEVMAWYCLAANQGLARAQYSMGLCSRNGSGVPQDSKQAAEWFRMAAEQGHAEAQNELGFCYGTGRGVTLDLGLAVVWYRKAANQGYRVSQSNLGNCYYKGVGVLKDFGQAVPWYRKAADQGHADAQTSLAICYSYGNGIARDPGLAVAWFRKAANQGHVEAHGYLGFCYEEGYGVDEDLGQAVAWYRKGADQGDVAAQSNLGRCYENGRGVSRDPGLAVAWYQEAADQGDDDAQCKLGWCYERGVGIAEDPEEAVLWYRKAADQGHMQAQTNLGFCYYKGIGVVEDPRQAVAWFHKAADLGDAHSLCNMGVFYESGLGVAQDLTEAVAWYRKAADQGHANGQYNLGICYDDGRGVTKDPKEAVAWYQKAADQGHPEALSRLHIR